MIAFARLLLLVAIVGGFAALLAWPEFMASLAAPGR